MTLAAGRLPVAAVSKAWPTSTPEGSPASERWGAGGGGSRGVRRRSEAGVREQGRGSGSYDSDDNHTAQLAMTPATQGRQSRWTARSP